MAGVWQGDSTRLGRGEEDEQLQVFGYVNKAVPIPLRHEDEGSRPDGTPLTLDLELGAPREHVVDLVFGVRALPVRLAGGETVDAGAEHPGPEELVPGLAGGAGGFADLIEINEQADQPI